MLRLYIQDSCPYCAMVVKAVDELGLDPEYKNISDEAVLQELIEKGGKRQVPFLVDTEHDVALFESADIIDYLMATYPAAESHEETETNADIAE